MPGGSYGGGGYAGQPVVNHPGPYGVSAYLVDLAATSHYEGSYVYTIWSSADEVIGYGTTVYGQSTCRIPAQNGDKTYSSYPYGQIGSKDRRRTTNCGW